MGDSNDGTVAGRQFLEVAISGKLCYRYEALAGTDY